MANKKYPIGIQNFEKIRNDGYIYVDKTALMYQLVDTGSYYFLSRPRRFGKSLLLSTLHAYFDGKKELFEGLAVEKLEKDWVKRPVFHLDLNIEKYDAPESLDHILEKALAGWETLYGANPSERSFPLRFAGVIQRAHEQSGHRVAILVDEYDKPMLQAIGNEELQTRFRTMLKPFYGVLKTMDGDIKFGMLTGVTKFGKVSVFSDLNNLDDISMQEPYLSVCGINEKELHVYFDDDIHALAETRGKTYEETATELREMYDGYHFMEYAPGIYNPFSLLHTFKYRKFGSYWFETGTPTYLVELLRRHQFDLHYLEQEEVDSDTLNGIDSTDTDPIPVIYQSGYLTIKGYDKRFGLYRLGFPNREVEEGFVKYLLPFYADNVEERKSDFYVRKFVQEVESGDYDSFFRRLSGFFADTPYELVRQQELHYQNVLFIIFRLMGFYTKVEYHTSEGRVDLVLQTDRFIYIMEFKFDGTAEDALRQIEEKHYAAPFAADPRRLFKIGVNFSRETRTIERWLVV